jgi:hypothetical protein
MSTEKIRKNNTKQRKNGQSMLDYVIFLTIIVATLLVMGYYIRNSLAQKHREAADTFGAGEVYRPNVVGVDTPSVITRTETSEIDRPSRTYMW